jgi:Na+-translocating ferredoxin:NAD+ oxidoreductase RnfG subunit
MENFKLSKTGIIIIVIAAVVVVLLCAIFFVAGKKQQEISMKQQQKNAIGEAEDVSDEQYFPVFENYLEKKITSREAVKESGLSIGTFYRKLKKYEATK